MLRPSVVHVVAEQDVGLAGLDPRQQDADPEIAGPRRPDDGVVLRALQCPDVVVLHRAHEVVGDHDAVMQVQRLAVRIAAGRPAHLDEFLDLRVVDRQVAGGRAAAQRALADRQGQRIHHPDEGHDARGLAVAADLLADRAQVAPVAADAAALGGQPDVLVPQVDDAVQGIARLVEEAGDRQPALGAAVGQHWRRRHEPQVRDVVVDPLAVRGVVGEVRRDAGEEVLIGLALQQIAVVEGRLAERRQLVVPRAVHANRDAAIVLEVIADLAIAKHVLRPRQVVEEIALRGRIHLQLRIIRCLIHSRLLRAFGAFGLQNPRAVHSCPPVHTLRVDKTSVKDVHNI